MSEMIPQVELVLKRMDLMRASLLELGARNPLLHFPLRTSKGKLGSKRLLLETDSLNDLYVTLLEGRSRVVLLPGDTENLPEEAEETTFAEEDPADWDLQDDFFSTSDASTLELGSNETALTVPLDAETLKSRLLDMMRHATTLLEESGTNGLFLGLGRLEWREPKKPDEARFAPLILVPVQLERDLKRDVFKLKHTGEDVEPNFTLEVKLGTSDFGIQLPNWTDAEDLLPEHHLEEVARVCQGRAGWRVLNDAYLGFFNPAKIGLYRELGDKKLPDIVQDHPILIPLLGQDGTVPLTERQEVNLLDPQVLELSRHVLDADSSQAEAVWRTALGEHLVLQGPPGTGKSQTITNIIATAVSQGKTVLFVAEKEAALSVVEERLKRVGLEDVCLSLHSKDAKKTTVRDTIKKALEQGRNAGNSPGDMLDERQRLEAELHAYTQAVNTPVSESGLSPYQLYGKLLHLKTPAVLQRPLRLPESAYWSAEILEKHLFTVGQMQNLLQKHGLPQKLPHWGSQRISQTSAEDVELQVLGQEVRQVLTQLEHAAESVASAGFDRPLTVEQLMAVEKPWAWLRSAPDLQGVNLTAGVWRNELTRDLLWACEQWPAHKSFLKTHSLQRPTPPMDLSGLHAHLKAEQPFADLNVGQLQGVEKSLQQITRDLQQLEAGLKLFTQFQLPKPAHLQELESFLQVIRTFADQDLSGMDVKNPLWIQEEKALIGLLETGKHHASGSQRHSENLKSEVWDSDLISIRQVVGDLGKKWIRFFSPKYHKALGSFKNLHIKDAPTQADGQIELLDQLIKLQNERRKLQAASSELTQLFGTKWKGLDSNWEDLLTISKKLIAHHQQVQSRTLHRGTLSILEQLTDRDRRLDVLEELETLESQHRQVRNSLDQLKAHPIQLNLPLNLPFLELPLHLHQLLVQVQTQQQFLAQLSTVFLQVPAERETHLLMLKGLQKHQMLLEHLNQLDSWARDALTSNWKGEDSDFSHLSSVARYLQQTLQHHPEVWRVLEHNGKPPLDFAQLKLQQQAALLPAALSRLSSWLKMDAMGEVSTVPFDQLKRQVQDWCEQPTFLRHTVAFNQMHLTLQQAGLEEVWKVALEWPEATAHLSSAFEFTALEQVLQLAFEQPALAEFHTFTYESALERFRQLDTLLMDLHRCQVLERYRQQLPQFSGMGRMRILQNELGKKRRLMPIRRLVEQVGEVLQRIKPVFMMSPLSIANFLPLNALQFDLVLFDEASQVRPELGLGALLRGKQAVVVGDAKQMGPSNHFSASAKDLDADAMELDEETRDMQGTESLLDLFESRFKQHQSSLTWHYRSKHESLIATSNVSFYGKQLVTFPAARHKPGELGLVYHYLPDTIYIQNSKKGSSNASAPRGLKAVNPLEAEAVVRRAMKHAQERPHESLAVIAFSAAQQKMIYLQLEHLRPQMTAPQQQFLFPQEDVRERFVVKNLENMQGDERDVIFISVGYGRTEQGKVVSSFGTLNRADGWRSLNVLITRARLRCEVFANFEPEEIPNLDRHREDGEPTAEKPERALAAFARFLTRARDIGQNASSLQHTEVQDRLLEQVAQVLIDGGHQVTAHVGTSQDRIDLAVHHPDHPEEYVLGVLLDGPSRSRGRWGRDRDRLRPAVLSQMGWQLYRVWSTDWYRDPAGEAERLLKHLNQVLTEPQIQTVPDVPEPSVNSQEENLEESDTFDSWFDDSEDDFFKETPAKSELHFGDYLPSLLTISVEPSQLANVYSSTMAVWLKEIVNFEGPMHRDHLARRMREAAGAGKMGSRIQMKFNQAVEYGVDFLGLTLKGPFVWGTTQPTLRDRSTLPASERNFDYICDEEIDLALLALIQHAGGIEDAELIVGCTRAFGFDRTTQEIRQRIEDRISALLVNQQLQKRGDFLVV